MYPWCDADSGWNVTKALAAYHPAIAVAVPSAATTSQHCVVSSVSQHSAVTQASTSTSTQQSDALANKGAAGMQQPVIHKLTEQGDQAQYKC